MKTKKILGISIIFSFLTVVALTPFTRAYDNYELAIGNYYGYAEIQWQYTTVNQTLVEELVNENMCDAELLLIEQYQYISWDLYLVDETDFSWVLEINDEYYCNVFKDPSDFTEAWMFENEKFYTKRIIPCSVVDYLKGFKDNLPADKNASYEINQASIHEDLRSNNSHAHGMYAYNQEGFLDRCILYYDNTTAVEMNLINYYIEDYLPCGGCGPYPSDEILTITLIILGFIFLINLFIFAGMKGYYDNKRICLYRIEVGA